MTTAATAPAPPTAQMPLRELARLMNPPAAGDLSPVVGGQRQVPDTAGFSIRVLDERSAPGLAVRPLPEPGAAADAMAGHELWHPVTDAVVVAGLRQTASASRLLQLLPGGALNRVLLRAADVDREGFIAALTTGQARAAVEPSAVALARAADLAGRKNSANPWDLGLHPAPDQGRRPVPPRDHRILTAGQLAAQLPKAPTTLP